MYRYFLNQRNKTFHFLRQATEEEYQFVLPHVEKISDFVIDNKRIRIVNDTYAELINTYERISDGDVDLAKNGYLSIKLTSYLAAFRKFIDNWETHIKRKYGKKSDEARIFKKSTGKYYDNEVEYGFVYRLRNYDQHCEIVFSKIIESIDENEQIQRLVLVNRDRLLENFDDWKDKEVQFIKQQDEDFDLLPIIKKFQGYLNNIQSDLMSIYLKSDFFQSCLQLLKVANQFDDEDYICFASTEVEFNKEFVNQPNKTLHFTHLDIPLCKELLRRLIKANDSIFKIVYYGKDINESMKDIAIELSLEQRNSIEMSRSVTINNFTYIKALEKIDINTTSMYAILLNPLVSTNERKKIIDEFSSYISELCKF